MSTNLATTTAKEMTPVLPEVLGNAQGALTLRKALFDRIDRVRELLPEEVRSDAGRFIERGIFYFQCKSELWNCTTISVIECLFKSAEIGLALDGRLAHAVPFSKVATLIVDYKGLVVVAKRCKAIVDARAEVIRDQDLFTHQHDDAGGHISHSWDAKQPRGEATGYYARVLLPNNSWDYCILSPADIDKVRARSRAGRSGPWVTDYDEMAKKTCLRRLLKLRTDDPGVARALEISDEEFDFDSILESEAARDRVKGMISTLIGQVVPHTAPKGIGFDNVQTVPKPAKVREAVPQETGEPQRTAHDDPAQEPAECSPATFNALLTALGKAETRDQFDAAALKIDGFELTDDQGFAWSARLDETRERIESSKPPAKSKPKTARDLLDKGPQAS